MSWFLKTSQGLLYLIQSKDFHGAIQEAYHILSDVKTEAWVRILDTRMQPWVRVTRRTVA